MASDESTPTPASASDLGPQPDASRAAAEHARQQAAKMAAEGRHDEAKAWAIVAQQHENRALGKP